MTNTLGLITKTVKSAGRRHDGGGSFLGTESVSRDVRAIGSFHSDKREVETAETPKGRWRKKNGKVSGERGD